MKCDWARENILLLVYDELPDDARFELEQHVARCSDCAAELKSARALQAQLSQFSVEEPPPSMVVAARMHLQEALETATQGGWWRKLAFEPALWFRQLRFSPALATAILMAGFAGGAGASYQLSLRRGQQTPLVTPSSSASEASISGIRSVSQEAGSNQISIKYDTVMPQEAQGSLNDQRIQQLLLFAARNNYNSGVRMDSVDLLTKKPSDVQVREVLAYALRYDSNPGVRLKALDGLGTYVKDDVHVRDAVLEALMNDANPGVRTEALRLILPVRADGSVRLVLQRLAQNDQNPYIRSQARTLVAQLPQID